jgi:pyruvate-formate lyase
MDINGITAFMNSLVKLDTSVHAGAVQNMKFSKNYFSKYKTRVSALLNTYFKIGGAQAMITVIDKGILEDAMKYPEKYPNVMVRVGGFSARFVELSKEVQFEILRRTLYEENF